MSQADQPLSRPIREAVGVFEDRETLQKAIDDLSLAGIERRRLSLMAGDRAIADRLGWVPSHIDQARHNPDIPRSPVVAPEEVGNAQGVAIGIPAYVGAVIVGGAVIATGGTALAAAFAAALAGAGSGAAGSVLSSWFAAKRDEPLRQHLDKGGILMWVNLEDGDEPKILDILSRHAQPPVTVHEVTAGGPE
jgi:hypothetical protein